MPIIINGKEVMVGHEYDLAAQSIREALELRVPVERLIAVANRQKDPDYKQYMLDTINRLTKTGTTSNPSPLSKASLSP